MFTCEPNVFGHRTSESGSLPLGPTTITRDEIAKKLGWQIQKVWAATALCLATGDVVETANGQISLTARGYFHRAALNASRNEGGDHCGLLADVGACLTRLGIRFRVAEQKGGYLRPDGEFRWRGQDYHLEVECSSLVKHQEQVLRNVRKAFANKVRCLVAVPDKEAAQRVTSLLKRDTPPLELWREVGMLWRAGVGQMVPYVPGPRKPWGFLPGGVEDESKGSLGTGTTLKKDDSRAAPQDPRTFDVALVRHWARRLLAADKWEVTADEFEGVFGEAARTPVDRVRLGMALETLGVKKIRARRGGAKRATYYDLRTLPGPSGSQPGDLQQAAGPVRNLSDNPQEKGPESESKTDGGGLGGQGRADGQTYEEMGGQGSGHGGLTDDFG